MLVSSFCTNMLIYLFIYLFIVLLQSILFNSSTNSLLLKFLKSIANLVFFKSEMAKISITLLTLETNASNLFSNALS